jgi:signal peptidase
MIKRLLTNLAMVVTFGIAGLMIVPAALGFHRYVILTGSMTGTYDRGSIVFDRPIATSELKVGDPITYAPPPGASPNQKLVTHRIHAIDQAPDGRRVYVTKGDFNEAADNWKFVLPQPTQDKVMFHVPYAGYVFMALQIPQIRLLLIGLPALAMGFWIVLGMWREGGEIAKRRQEGVRPWGPDVGRTLPELARLVDGDPAAGRATVRLPVSWPEARRDPRRRHQPAVVASAPLPTRRDRGVPGRVPLPEGCVAVARRRRDAAVRGLPAGWRLIVRTQTAA